MTWIENWCITKVDKNSYDENRGQLDGDAWCRSPCEGVEGVEI